MAAKFKSKKVENRGKVSWMVDLRSIGQGRQFRETKADADALAAEKNAERASHGAAGTVLTDEEKSDLIYAKAKLAPLGHPLKVESV